MNLDEDNYKPGDFHSRISNAKNNLVSAQAYLANRQLQENDRFHKRPETANIYAKYQLRCKQSDAMDFDDLLLNTNVLFRDKPEILDKYRQKFRYILVDEYQDTNFSQYLIVRKMSEYHKNLCVVGDDAQSIYSFRGAKIENILNFKNDYPEHKVFKLEQNYRSTQTIVDAANSIIKKNKAQIQKNTFSQNEIGDKIKVLKCSTDAEEGYRVAMNIESIAKEDGCRYQDFAILYRTNAQSRILEEALNKLRIPCKIHGGLSFFQRKEIKDVVAYFRLVINPKDEEALARIINFPQRGIGDTTIEKLTTIASNNQMSLWDVICKIEQCEQVIAAKTCQKIASFREMIFRFSGELATTDAYTFANNVLDRSQIMKELNEDKSIEGQGRYENVQELLNGIKEFTEKEEENSLLNYLEKIALFTDLEEGDDKNNKVTLMTVHSAKGLEFKHCFIVGLEENLFPSQMSMTSEKDVEEERRLFYVALTRAEKSATLSYANTRRHWGKLANCTPSRFIKELDPSYLDLKEVATMGFQTSGSSFESFTIKKNTFGQESKPASFSSFKKPEISPFGKPANSTQQSSSNGGLFEPDSPTAICVDMNVEHQSFGTGRVISIEGVFPNSKVTVDFNGVGRKTLLMKFAKLRIVQ